MDLDGCETIYILGAGSSIPDGGLPQGELLSHMLDPSLSERTGLIDEIGLEEYQSDIWKFIEEVFGPRTEEVAFDLPLEDLFTVVDRGLEENASIGSWGQSQLGDVRRALNACLVCVMKNQLQNSESETTEIFVNDVVQEEDCSIISLNWDILIDNALHASADDGLWTVEYGTEVHPYHRDRSAQGAVELPLGKIGLYKLHGSLNWLSCPQCQRLYAGTDRKIAYDDFHDPAFCPACTDDETQPISGPRLTPLFVTPSFLKSLSTHSLSNIWTKAGRELSLASRLVFIGYSFPLSDFEFRYLLAKNAPSEASVEVVLKSDDGCPPEDSAERRRYQSFFGAERCSFTWEGFEEFVLR